MIAEVIPAAKKVEEEVDTLVMDTKLKIIEILKVWEIRPTTHIIM